MSERSFYGGAVDLIAEATERHGPGFRLDPEMTAELPTISILTEALAKRTEGQYDIEVDDNMRLTVSVVCDELILDSTNVKEFCQLVRLADATGFSTPGVDMMTIRFRFDRFWKKV